MLSVTPSTILNFNSEFKLRARIEEFIGSVACWCTLIIVTRGIF